MEANTRCAFEVSPEEREHEYTKRLMSDVPLLHGRNSILEQANVTA